MAPWVCLQFVIVVFSDDTYLLILNFSVNYILTKINDIENLKCLFLFNGPSFCLLEKKIGRGLTLPIFFHKGQFLT